MMIAIPTEHWSIFADLNNQQFCQTLQDLASQVRLSAFLSHPRGPKKKKKKPEYDTKHPHASTARLLEMNKNKNTF